MSCELQGVECRSILPTKLVATATSFEGSKNNFRSFICGQSSTNPAHFVKIGPVDVDIIGLIEITKICIKITAKHTPCSPGLRAERVS